MIKDRDYLILYKANCNKYEANYKDSFDNDIPKEIRDYFSIIQNLEFG